MSGVLRFLMYLYLKILLLIGYDFLFHRDTVINGNSLLVAPPTDRLFYFAAMLFAMPLVDTIILALPIYLSLKRKGSMRYIMLAITFIIEFLVYYFKITHRVLEDRLIVKIIVSILVFVLIYRKYIFVKSESVA